MKILFLLLAISTSSYAQFYTPPPPPEKTFGAGVMIGEPTGLNFQVRQSEHFFDFGAGRSLNHEPTFFSDYKHLFPSLIPLLIRKSTAPITAYVGIGGYMQFAKVDQESKLFIGARVPLGFDWSIKKQPIAVFLELVPVVRIITSTAIDFMAVVGVRYYF